MVQALKRARQPRYAAGLVAGVAYFAFMGWMMIQPDGPAASGFRPSSMAGTLGPVLLAFLAVGWWVSGRTHMALAFTPAEVEFLFQAPISRRTLLHYKLLRTQGAIVPLSLVFGVFMGAAVPVHPALAPLSFWLVMTIAQLHQVASGLVRSAWSDQGGAGWRSHKAPAVVIAAAGVAVVWAFWPLLAEARAATSPQELGWAFQRAMGHPAAAAVFLPFQVAVAPLLAQSLAEWGVAVLGGAGLLVLHYLWVMRSDAAFEEAAAEAGVELQTLTAAFREGRLEVLQAAREKRLPPPPFRLAPVGHPAMAVFWKNLTAFTRSVRPRVAVVFTVTFVGLFYVLRLASDDPAEVAAAAAGIPIVFGVMALILGPIFTRNDLRTDFQRLEIIRTLPLKGRDLVVAEVAASGASLTVVAGFFFTVGMGLFALGGADPFGDWRPWGAYGAAMLVLPLVAVLATGVQNLLAVVFPGWMPLGPTQPQGLDQTGGLLVMMMVTGVAMTLGLLVPVVVGGAIAFRLVFVLGVWALLPAVVGAVAALAAEVAILLVLLGDAFDELDPSAEGLLG